MSYPSWENLSRSSYFHFVLILLLCQVYLKAQRVKRRDGFQGVRAAGRTAMRLALAIWWKAHRYFLLQNYF